MGPRKVVREGLAGKAGMTKLLTPAAAAAAAAAEGMGCEIDVGADRLVDSAGDIEGWPGRARLEAVASTVVNVVRDRILESRELEMTDSRWCAVKRGGELQYICVARPWSGREGKLQFWLRGMSRGYWSGTKDGVPE